MNKAQKIILFIIFTTIIVAGVLIAYIQIEENKTIHYDRETTYHTTTQRTTMTTTTKSLEQLKNECIKVSYNNLSRHPKDYEGNCITIKGRVLQVLEETDGITLRVATKYDSYLNQYYEDVFLVAILDMDENNRILEADKITIYGTYLGMSSYTTITGAQNTIPSLYSHSYILK